MVNKNLLVEKDQEIIIKMTGEGLDDTISLIFKKLKNEVYNSIAKPIIHMETKEFYFETIDCEEKTERYMFLFMPRVKKYYTVTAKIVVTVKYLDLEKEDI